MSISVYNALLLPQLKNLKLVSGENGLNKIIEKIGILDHEMIEGIIGNFTKGDFVITTFTAIRDDKSKIEKCIKDLAICEISALAIKNIYVKELSKNIIDFANRHKLPILFFEENIYFEDVIEDLMSGMLSRSHMELMASKIDILFNNDLKKNIVRDLAYEINRNFYNEHIVIFCKEKRYLNDESLINTTERYSRSRAKSIHHSIIKYKEGLVIILTYKKITNKDIAIDTSNIFKSLNITEKTFYIGKSTYAFELMYLDESIKESIFASRSCELLNENPKNYEDIGIYKLLLPYANDKWLQSFTNSLLDLIKRYDDGKFINTARIFIKNNGDINLTALEMYQHKNTIRYRINKMKELLSIDSENEFYEQLSIAIKCEKLI
ncbi:PucR family transcriptional regulator [Helicovermis profundi]|uniref:PucR family transcriptional regulator n=1 Tax=Helicovermis profundi TaxID=3065157 RepID=A0AAU9ENI2_9FIRM|nr:hypothetical protein HLPR_11970 [Clostridia bacterium S502]